MALDAAETRAAAPGQRIKVAITSRVDGSEQPCYVILPDGFDSQGPRRALLVSLHSWSADVEQRNEPLERLTAQRGWIYLRRYAGPSRVTIFEGGHEGIAAAAIEWLDQHRRQDGRSGN